MIRMLARPVFVSALLVGCGGAPKPAPPPVPAAATTPAATGAAAVSDRIATAYGGPKLRVAVGDFKTLEGAEALFEQMGWKGMGPMITEQTVTALVQTGRVAVLERGQIRTVVGNTQLEKESDLAKYFDQKTTVESDKLQGAQAVLVGAITEFEPNVSGANAGIEVELLGDLKYHEDKAVIGVELRLVDQETGRVIHAGKGRAEMKTTQVDGSTSYAGVELNTDAWWRTPIGSATRKATDIALADLLAGLPGIPWQGRIIDVKGPEKVFIDAGAQFGLKKGDRFRIVHRGEPIQGPGGELMGYDEAEGGWAELVTVQEKLSIAKVAEGDPPKVGDVVRLPAE